MRIILGNENIFSMKINIDGELSSCYPFYCDCAGCCYIGFGSYKIYKINKE